MKLINQCRTLYNYVTRVILKRISDVVSYKIPIPIHRQYAGLHNHESIRFNEQSMASAIINDHRQPILKRLWAYKTLKDT